MSKACILAATAVALALSAIQTVAAAASGAYLSQTCGKAVQHLKTGHTDSPVDAAQCVGFVQGVTDGYATAISLYTGIAIYCEPPGVTLQQRVLITEKYLNSHPEVINQEASSLVLVAMREAFPCER
jgi:hypothetical protein